MKDELEKVWLDASLAWRICASVHREFARGKDSLFNTRQADFLRHAEESMKKAKEVIERDEK